MSQPEMKEELTAGAVKYGWVANTQGARRKMLMPMNTWGHGHADERSRTETLYPDKAAFSTKERLENQ